LVAAVGLGEPSTGSGDRFAATATACIANAAEQRFGQPDLGERRRGRVGVERLDQRR